MASTANSSHIDIRRTHDNTPAATAALQPPLPSDHTIDVTHNPRLPIHRLPTEILGIIFRNITRVETCIHDPYVTVSRTITLSAVCSHWRMTIINNSTFWTYIPIRNTPKSHRITSLCLERSRNSLIDISAYLAGADPWCAEKTLSLYVHRVRSLYICSRRIEHVRSVMEFILSNGVPRSLKHLSIKPISPYHMSIVSGSILPPSFPELREIMYGLVQQLHTLRLSEVALAPGSYSFDRLRNLLLERACPAEVVQALTSSSDVQSIEIRNLVSGEDHDLPTNLPVVMGNMKKLCFRGITDSTTLCNMLGSLLPGPYEIDLTINAGRALLNQVDDTTSGLNPGPPCGADILGTLLRRFDNITRLTLESSIGTPSPVLCDKVHMVLQNLPNLCYLNLVVFQLTQPMLAAMTRSYEQEPNRAFPLLRRLRLRDTLIVDYEAFKTMIFSHHIDRIRISRCLVKWDGDAATTHPSPSSSLYKWLSIVVPKVSIG